MCVIVHNFGRIGQTVLEISQFFFQFLRWPLSAIMEFEILKLLVAHEVGRVNVHHDAKFHQNRSNGC